MNLGSARLYASGPGIILYARSLLVELRSASSSAKRDRLYSKALGSGRAVQLATGSPQLYYHCSFSTRPGPAKGNPRARTTFGLLVDEGGLGICDAYAELDWADESYQHKVVDVPSGYYRVDAAYLAKNQYPKDDMDLFFQLTAGSHQKDPPSDDVELMFEP